MINRMSATLAVDEAIKRNEALTSAKAKQEATIVSLKKVRDVTLRHFTTSIRVGEIFKRDGCIAGTRCHSSP